MSGQSFTGSGVVILPDEPYILNVNGEDYRGKLKFVINPDGKGFDVTGLNPRERSGWGLVNMKERAQALGGKFKIESSPAEGTQVEVEWVTVVPLVVTAGDK